MARSNRPLLLLLLLVATSPPTFADAQQPERCDPARLEDRTHVPLPPTVAPSQQSIRGRQELAAFTIELPPGWRNVRYQRAVPERDVPESVRFEGPNGLYLQADVDRPGQGLSTDGKWRCGVPDGRVRITEEEPLCVVPPGVEVEEEGCAAGDGRLDLFTLCEVGRRRIVFVFGSTTREQGVDLDVFRRILATVRLK